jgi:PAS domain S-box-containing protein
MQNLLAANLKLIIPPEKHRQLQQHVDLIKEQEVHVNEVTQNLTKSGEKIWMTWSNRLMKSGEGSGKELLFVGNDITEEVRHKEQLRETERFFRSVLELAPDGLLVADADGSIRLANAQCEKLFGYTRDEIIGQPVEMLVPADVRPRHPALRDSFFKAPSARAMGAGRELRAQRKDGTVFLVEVGLSPFHPAPRRRRRSPFPSGILPNASSLSGKSSRPNRKPKKPPK